MTSNDVVLKPAFSCHWCNKVYLRRENLNKHELLCEITYKKGNTANIALPSQAQLFTMVTQLTKRVQILESKVDDMEHGRKKRKTKDVLSELNSDLREKPSISLDEFIDNFIDIEDHVIDLFLQKGVGYHVCFEEIIKSIVFQDNTPMQLLSQKVFIYINDSFEEWTKPISLAFFEKIKVKILKALLAWKERNGGENVDKDEALGMKYNSALLKVMRTNFTTETGLSQKLRSIMCKQDLKGVNSI